MRSAAITTKLSSALKDVNSNIKNTQSQLKDVQKLLKLAPSNSELLAQKQKLLAEAVGETKEKLETLRMAAEAGTAIGEFNNMRQTRNKDQPGLDLPVLR